MGQSPYELYGLFLCRGDVDQVACYNCVGDATKTIANKCPYHADARVWYDQCLFRYSSISFFGILDGSELWFPHCNETNIANINVSSFMGQVNDMLKDMATRTAKRDQSGKYFATDEAKISESVTLYALEQCSPDLSTADCNQCLADSIANLFNSGSCFGKKGGTLFFGTSCYVRYENFPFYQIAGSAPAANPVEGNKNATLTTKKNSSSRKLIIAIVTPVGIAVLLVSTRIYFLMRKKEQLLETVNSFEIDSDEFATAESLQYDLHTLQLATNHFSSTSMIGEGGVGEVYKGTLANGQEIAVKRFSKISDQGTCEFKNEVHLVAKLHHKNLVRLLGFCLARDEKLLVYEFVPNKSLDYFLFDPQRQGELDWSMRYKIIRGIARGLLYLHEYSRLRVVHRDLKASNILLDMDMNPKVSDFGLAKVFGMNQTHNATETVAGTLGYMAPEYLLHGQFSTKSDVYSYGVLVLEIVSGKENTSFHRTGLAGDLLSYAWKTWINGRALELLDPTIRALDCPNNEVKLCIQLGLLCVQKDLHNRPSMGRIVHMLNSHSLSVLPVPQHPPFFTESNEYTSLKGKEIISNPSSSGNEALFTEVEPR